MLSIVIPTYSMHGQGIFFLERCIRSIVQQQLLPEQQIEIIISDQSTDHHIQQWVQGYQINAHQRIPLRYQRVRSKLGYAAHNLNVGIAAAHYPYCKILFQDDLLVETHYLARIFELLKTYNPQCIFTGACHTTDGKSFFNPIEPADNPYLLFGNNTVSSPSVVTINRSFARAHPFDEQLKMLFDCAFYYEVFRSGQPILLAPEIHIANGIWEGQAQHGIDANQFTQEVRHLHQKYPQAQLIKHLPAYQELFALRHPHATFPFSTILEPTLANKLQEWWAQYQARRSQQ